jgi:predicted RNA polymerase sigma factor
MAFGPQAGLDLVDTLRDAKALRGYHLLPSVRGDLLARLGRYDEAHDEFVRAASLTQNARERELLLGRAAACAWNAPPGAEAGAQPGPATSHAGSSPGSGT